MKHWRQQARLGSALLALSLLLYLIHYALFRDAHYIALYLVGNIAFLPIEVLIVTLIIQRLLSERERRALLSKLNMVIGAFFSEVGGNLIRELARVDRRMGLVGGQLVERETWEKGDFGRVEKALAAHTPDLALAPADLHRLRDTLLAKRDFLLRLLENPNLLEHESFSDLLWSVFHLTEELEQRSDLAALPATDVDHLTGDAARVFRLIIVEWLAYMRHLRSSYPYLYSLAMRMNPFDPKATAVIWMIAEKEDLRAADARG